MCLKHFMMIVCVCETISKCFASFLWTAPSPDSCWGYYIKRVSACIPQAYFCEHFSSRERLIHLCCLFIVHGKVIQSFSSLLVSRLALGVRTLPTLFCTPPFRPSPSPLDSCLTRLPSLSIVLTWSFFFPKAQNHSHLPLKFKWSYWLWTWTL